MGGLLRFWFVAACLLTGCPRDVDVPEVPARAQACDTHEDCNDASCGRLRACVDGLCEPPDAGSLGIPCP